MFPGGIVAFGEDDGTIKRGLIAWEFARAGRRVIQTFEQGQFRCEMLGDGTPIIGTSMVSAADAGSQALNQAADRDYVERYGTAHYQELSSILVELQKLAS